ncbi:MAG: helix-turn-helix transcriptional regulator, partial [Treponema sp.]|nr:helix-turn-helix transcriptional regulator [Treponema sp.]
KVKELAAKTGLNRKTIDNYLTKNSADPSATNAVKIAKALNVTVEYLVTGASKNEEILLPDNQTTDFLKIIKKLKNLPAEQKKIIFSIVDSFHELTKNQMPE